MPQPEPGRMRVSNEEREAVASQLHDALDSGRLGLDEFDQRTRDLYSAQTYDEVNRLLEDLPAAHLPVPSEPRAAPPPEPERAPTAVSNKMGHIALGMGVMSLASFMPFTVLAIVFGIIGLDNAKKGKSDNRSFALTGLILGGVSIPLWIVFVVIGAAYWW